jgi:hypothetical protein
MIRPDPKLVKVLPSIGDHIEETLKFLENKTPRIYHKKGNPVTTADLDEAISRLCLGSEPIYQDTLAEIFECYYQWIGKTLTPEQKARMASHNIRIKNELI